MRNWVWLRNEGSEGPGRASSRRVELPNSDPAPQVWRAPEGPEGLAAVPVGGGRARAGLEIDHSEPSGSRVAISRAGRRPRAHKVARPNKTEDPATGSLATRAAAEQCTGCTAIGTAANQRKTPAQPPAFTASQQHSQKSYEKYESFIGSS